jgi:hypothetical protein
MKVSQTIGRLLHEAVLRLTALKETEAPSRPPRNGRW